MEFPSSVPSYVQDYINYLTEQTWSSPVPVGDLEFLRTVLEYVGIEPTLISLTDDIIVNDGLPIRPANGAVIKILGNGHKIDGSQLEIPDFQNGRVGVISIEGGALYLEDVEISTDYNPKAGSAIYAFEGSVVLEDGAVIQHNLSWQTGSGIFIDNGTGVGANILLMRNGSSVQENRSLSHSAGIVCYGNFVMEEGATIARNQAGTETYLGAGGGITITASTEVQTWNVISGTIEDNNPEEVSGTDGSAGGGGISVLGAYHSEIHFILNNAKIKGNRGVRGGGVYVTREVRCEIIDSDITNNFAFQDGGGLYVDTTWAIEISGNTNITDNTAGKDGGAIYVRYDPVLGAQPLVGIEGVNVGPDVVFENNKAEHSYKIDWDVDGATYNDHIQATQFSVPYEGAEPFDNGYNNLDISYTNGEMVIIPAAPATVTISVAVHGGDEPLPSGRFEFGLYEESEDLRSSSLISTATNDEDGNVTFPPITLATDGEYHFSVSQITESDDEWLIDGSTFRISITAFDDGSGTIQTAEDYPDGPPEFDNVHQAPAAGPGSSSDATVSATLKICGYDPPSATFSFGLYNEAGQLVAETDMSESGEIVLGPVEFDTPGSYPFSIRQISSSIPGWTLDSRTRTATVVVREREGELQARMRPDMLVFVNKYGTCP